MKLLTRPGSVFDPQPARRLRDLLRGRAPALRPDLALPRAAPRRPAPGRELRLDLRHVHRRAASRHRPALHDRRAAGRRLGRLADADGNPAMFSGFHGDTFNCPAEVAEARYGLYVDRLSLNDAAGRRGRAPGRQGDRASSTASRSNGCFFTCAYTRNVHRPWPMAGGLEGSPNYAEVVRTDGSVEQFAVVTGLEVDEGDVIRIHTGSGGGFGDPRRRPRELVARGRAERPRHAGAARPRSTARPGPEPGATTPSRSRSSQASLQAVGDEMFAVAPQDGDERDHLRGPRRGYRRSPTATATSPPPAPGSRPSSACSTRR